VRAGPRTRDTRSFSQQVYRLVRRVPRGKVVTYGQVAALVGRPRAARAVGLALGALHDDLIDDVPWQRVIGAAGRPTHRDEFWAGVQRDLLEGEGVRFDRRGRIDLGRARWPGPRRESARRRRPLTRVFRGR
jgi:methylated-DNA-protein-cysteine methyltransferase-like protein